MYLIRRMDTPISRILQIPEGPAASPGRAAALGIHQRGVQSEGGAVDGGSII